MSIEAGSGGRAVAITGASGLLGRALCSHLSRRGWQVRALVRDPQGLVDPPAGARVGGCYLPEAIDHALLAGAAALVHCAYGTRVTALEEARRVNEDGTRLVLEASRRAGVARFVFISTIAAHPRAPSYYARSKHVLEHLMDPRRDLVIRPGLILAREGQGLFQQMQDNIRRLRAVPVFGGGRQPLQTVHIDDICEAVARALELELTGALNVAEPNPVPLADFLRMIAERMRVGCVLVPLPLPPVLAVVRMMERLGLPSPVKSESLLGMKALREVPVVEDLDRLGLTVRSARQSIEDLL